MTTKTYLRFTARLQFDVFCIKKMNFKNILAAKLTILWERKHKSYTWGHPNYCFGSCLTFPVKCSSYLNIFNVPQMNASSPSSEPVSSLHSQQQLLTPVPSLHSQRQPSDSGSIYWFSSVQHTFLFCFLNSFLPCDHGYSTKKAKMWTESWMLKSSEP